jgi:hypothetical protein
MSFLTMQNRKCVFLVRFAALMAGGLVLAGCETDGTGSAAADAPKAESASARPDTATPRTQAAKPPESVHNAEPMTRSRAARECWMRTEKGNPHEDLDRRADSVNRCIDDKLKAANAPAPKT